MTDRRCETCCHFDSVGHAWRPTWGYCLWVPANASTLPSWLPEQITRSPVHGKREGCPVWQLR